MEVQESFWSVGERTVLAQMESYLDKSDEFRVEVRELELLMGPEESEVNLMYDATVWENGSILRRRSASTRVVIDLASLRGPPGCPEAEN